MISSEEAIEIVLSNTRTSDIKKVNILEATGKVLMEDITADRDFPPFNRVAMDGIAINSASWGKGIRSFSVEGMQTAGSPQKKLHDSGSCMEVMTGAILPENTDAVIPYEDVEISGNLAHVRLETVKKLQNVHQRGSDRQAGDILIKMGVVLSPAEIAILATVGKSEVKVAAPLKVAIVTTGDELVEIHQQPESYQIRQSNVFALRAAMKEFGQTAQAFHIKDDAEELKVHLSIILNNHDLVILSGGVSKGKKDYVPEVLESLQVRKFFHGVKQRPGKPFWFGKQAVSQTAVFALPGNPVSTFMCYYRYVKPWLCSSYGINEHLLEAALAEDFNFPPDLTYFLQVKIVEKEGVRWATPVTGKGSGDLANLIEADAFLELPASRTEFRKGEVFPVYLYR